MEAGKNPLKLRTRKKYDEYHGRKRLWRHFYKDGRDVGFYEIYLEPETATEKPIIRIEIYGFNIYEKANAESILLTEEDIQKAGRSGVKSLLRHYLKENTDFVCDYLIKDFEEMKDYRDELVKAERGKEEKKETKPKEEAVVEKLAELIEEKERLERELAGETVEGKTPPERTTPISEEERVRERIEEELAKAEKNPDELIFPPPDIPLTFEQVAGLKGIPVFMREDSCFWVPRYVHTSESLLEQVRSEELFKDKFEVVKREIDLLICPKEGVKYGKDYVYHSLVVVYPPTIPQKPVGALFLFKVPRRRFAEILRFRKHVLERFIKGKKKERSREELDFAARVAEEILRRIRIREEISRRIGRV